MLDNLPGGLSEQQLLAILDDESTGAIGVDIDDELTDDRERSLRYYRGDMKRDMPPEPNRSKVVSTDVFEAIETLLPDLVEVFIAGDDVVTFRPVGAEDEGAASQETQVVNHVVMEQNNGFLTLYTAFKDALLTKTGILHWYVDEEKLVEDESFSQVQEQELELLAAQEQAGDVSIVKIEQDATGYSVTLRRERARKVVKVCAVAPEDFAVARETVLGDLPKSAYVSYRTRMREQDLIARGYDRDRVRRVQQASVLQNDQERFARDTINETENAFVKANAHPGLRVIEVTNHYLRADLDEDGDIECYRIVTGGRRGSWQLLDVQPMQGPTPFAVITPYIITHRLFGRSVADVMIEIQRIKTSLLRLGLDAGYFALNSRHEVSDTASNEHTWTDLLNNVPGMPVRSVNGNAVRPISPGGGLGFDPWQALEFASVMGESRSGAMRNAQGLKPDTLHDTKGGAEILINAAQKRVRMIARVFAETGVREMFLGVHDLLRRHGYRDQALKLRNEWVPIDPTTWRARYDMTVSVGAGSASRQDELEAARGVLALQIEALERQGGLDGPFVRPEHIYNTLRKIVEKGGLKSVDLYFADPKDAPEQQEKGPSPQEQEMQAKLELQRAEMEGKLALQREQIEREHELAIQKMHLEAQLSQQKTQIEAQTRVAAGPSNGVGGVRFGGQVG